MTEPAATRDGVTASVWASLDGSVLWEFLPPSARPDPRDPTQWSSPIEADSETCPMWGENDRKDP